MRLLLIATVSGLAAFTAACTHSTGSSGTPSFGQSVEAMQNEQRDNASVNTAPPEGSGAQAAGAQNRYRTGNTTTLRSASASTANP